MPYFLIVVLLLLLLYFIVVYFCRVLSGHVLRTRSKSAGSITTAARHIMLWKPHFHAMNFATMVRSVIFHLSELATTNYDVSKLPLRRTSQEIIPMKKSRHISNDWLAGDANALLCLFRRRSQSESATPRHVMGQLARILLPTYASCCSSLPNVRFHFPFMPFLIAYYRFGMLPRKTKPSSRQQPGPSSTQSYTSALSIILDRTREA